MTLGMKAPSTRVVLGEGKGEVRTPGMMWGGLVFPELECIAMAAAWGEVKVKRWGEVKVERGEEASKASKVHCIVTMATISTPHHTPGSVADLVLLNCSDSPRADLLPQDVQPHTRQVLVVLTPQLVPAQGILPLMWWVWQWGVAYSGSITPCHSMSRSLSLYMRPNISKLMVLRLPCKITQHPGVGLGLGLWGWG